MNNDELIAAGHELAKCLDNEPLLDIAKLLSKMATQLDVTTAELREKTKQCEQLAEECAALKDINKWCKTDAFKNMYREFKTAESLGCQDVDCMHDAMLTAIMHAPETPATDAFLREVKSQARQEGAYFVANRMLAAWDAGFIEDTAKNAADIARMILTSTEFMGDAPDGDFDRAFADSVLAEIASDLRQGGAA
ncbi:hypothetical protein B7T06_06575 [Cronobacter sakazakii]|uniref:hypothetical protein n=1 Tax=Cronobacter sakazakii TaxID=28141 RepID=UPI000A1698DD|nr:hypothetical protein [Cronobacter sakazakii]PUV97512.1 hypothetical protein B7T06_06575 [Cronobacter sakazakii]